jgi:hypothetical protein
MFIFPNKISFKNKSLQTYIDNSIYSSLQHKINNGKQSNKNKYIFIKSPLDCDLCYLNCEYDWSKKDLLNSLNDDNIIKKYINNGFKDFNYNKKFKKDILIPFYFYFFSTSSFFLLNYLL